MLDKSLPYWGLFMHRKARTPVASAPLPDGFRFIFFSNGDEMDWARLEASVLEFDSEFAALLHFNNSFLPYADELSRRCVFIQNEDGKKVATATAWWLNINRQHRPWLHWVAVEPQYQGLGLGKALVSHVLEQMIALEGDVDFYLHTQTWSYKAVNIYTHNGFFPTCEKALYKDKKNNYKNAMRIINRQLRMYIDAVDSVVLF